MTISDLLTDIYADEAAMPGRFAGIRTPRLSLNTHCDKKHVGLALELIPSNFDPFYAEAGKLLQHALFLRIKDRYELAEEEVAVPTSFPGGETHIDIFIPELAHAIEVKSCSLSAIAKEALSSPHKDQALLQWHFWMAAGYCLTFPEEARIDLVPKTYEVFYICRETYGRDYYSKPIKYDRLRAQKLQEHYDMIGEWITMEILPDPPDFWCWDCKDCAFQCFKQ